MPNGPSSEFPRDNTGHPTPVGVATVWCHSATGIELVVMAPNQETLLAVLPEIFPETGHLADPKKFRKAQLVPQINPVN